MPEDAQTQVRAAWLYYMEGLTQAEIADRLKMTRLRVNRLLVEARSSGLVNITINSRLESCVRLERGLVEEFGLREAIVVPTPADPAQIPALIGKAAGELVSRIIEEKPSGGFGVGWGATLRETIRHVRPGQYRDLKVTAMMGGLTYGIEINTFEIASQLARRWQAECHYLAAPIYAGTPQSRDTIVAQDVFEAAFERIRATEVAILSAGDLSERSLLVRYGLPRDVGVAELAAQGAVGDMLGQFIDADGAPIDHPINRRAIALPLEALRKLPTVILASGGSNKAAVLAAALRARLASVLITDEQAAAAALKLLRD
ncbi:sugar-binding transcriptional regulator [Bosea caraganae]|uniref:Sugar-binding transcriptional regulator n=1 Tax=Bosea caraganae TaxID=2763117 RepID=A0A370L4Y8_9HYPH|nr:sugar-binding transcriptional regulator [Bosea caraganae]RDJ22291.1 sugar-binding transcriptional regulator [Bosea caraganae]RDJ23775.1 sugar-binding transcriptional regulator [Bosea caraganae]